MGRRAVAFFCSYIFLMVLLTGWLMNVTFSDKYIAAGNSQSSYTLSVYKTRGRIYDRNMNIISGGASEYKAVINPTYDSTAKLLSTVDSRYLDGLEEKIKSGRPFVIDIPENLSGEYTDIIKCVRRYGNEPVAPHVTGYLSSEGQGVYGVEKAYDNLLESFGGEYKITYRVNALGESLGEKAIIRDTTHNSNGGVVLTIDSSIQLMAQRAAEQYLTSGAIVIMESETGDILACVSAPSFEQNNISKYLDADSSPLVNKAFSSYDVGSVFKLAVAASALEIGYEEFNYCCSGSIEIGDRIMKCSSTHGHGEINFEMAVAYSCNTYFIALSKEIGYKKILDKAKMLGFGSAVELGENYMTGTGNLPDEEELSRPAGLANFSFGQGSLMANPVQIAALTACIANDGEYITPRIVKETVNSNLEGIGEWKSRPPYTAIEKGAAQKIKKYMEAVMRYGTGRSVYSEHVSISAKTGSAETGITRDGRKVTRGWFAGFFPADEPQFVCVVLAEDAVSGTVSAGPCFKFIAERLSAIYGK